MRSCSRFFFAISRLDRCRWRARSRVNGYDYSTEALREHAAHQEQRHEAGIARKAIGALPRVSIPAPCKGLAGQTRPRLPKAPQSNLCTRLLLARARCAHLPGPAHGEVECCLLEPE